jgi:hypothetical protein
MKLVKLAHPPNPGLAMKNSDHHEYIDVLSIIADPQAPPWRYVWVVLPLDMPYGFDPRS